MLASGPFLSSDSDQPLLTAEKRFAGVAIGARGGSKRASTRGKEGLRSGVRCHSTGSLFFFSDAISKRRCNSNHFDSINSLSLCVSSPATERKQPRSSPLRERERDKKREKELRSKLKGTWKICFKSFSALEKKILFCVESSSSTSAFFFPLSNQPPFFSCLSFLSHVLSPHRFEGFGETAAAAKALATASRPFKGGGAGR